MSHSLSFIITTHQHDELASCSPDGMLAISVTPGPSVGYPEGVGLGVAGPLGGLPCSTLSEVAEQVQVRRG